VSNANKLAIVDQNSPYILHLVAHGLFAKEDPTTAQTEPGALLNDRQSVTKSKFFKNPMHRSELALVGAETTIEAWKREEVPPVEKAFLSKNTRTVTPFSAAASKSLSPSRRRKRRPLRKQENRTPRRPFMWSGFAMSKAAAATSGAAFRRPQAAPWLLLRQTLLRAAPMQ
jgi:hypothetical protein